MINRYMILILLALVGGIVAILGTAYISLMLMLLPLW